MPASKKSVIITFDYEVFLGRETGTIRNCVLNPTNAVLKILKENNATAIFFVDATWLLFLKEEFSSDFHLVAVLSSYRHPYLDGAVIIALEPGTVVSQVF